MKRTIVALLAVLSIIACKKKNDAGCSTVPPADEADAMAAFCNAQAITYTVDENGIFYQVINQGSGVSPNVNSTVTVTYTTTALDGNIVENKAQPVTLPLNQFIEGWRIALPYIQEGGRIKMVIPSSLAYGCTGIANLVAPNTPLYYDVVLIKAE